jgi:hypothetical protein
VLNSVADPDPGSGAFFTPGSPTHNLESLEVVKFFLNGRKFFSVPVQELNKYQFCKIFRLLIRLAVMRIDVEGAFDKVHAPVS